MLDTLFLAWVNIFYKISSKIEADQIIEASNIALNAVFILDGMSGLGLHAWVQSEYSITLVGRVSSLSQHTKRIDDR